MSAIEDAGGSVAAGFHLMAKPSGPACNLDCTYCFYLEKEALFDKRATRRMSPEVLEAYVRSTIAATPADQPVQFAWQGGEPTLLGLPFYRKAMELQALYGGGRIIQNMFQTNGTLIDEEWARFLAENQFLVGLSLDGPAEIHDRYRRYRNGAPSHHRVMAALKLLQRHNVAVNILACVDANSASHPLEVYRFLKAQGVDFIQFTPVVERLAGKSYTEAGFDLEGPKPLSPGERGWTEGSNPEEASDLDDAAHASLAPFAVRPRAWGRFLAAIFEEWRRKDVGHVFVMNFEWALAGHMKVPGSVCVHQKECGRALIAEHNGDVFSCDHFAYPEYRLGNLVTDSLPAMIESTRQQEFGRAKHETLPAQCRTCPVLDLCWGGCPKHRFLRTREGEPGLNYLCEGYHGFFTHARPWLDTMAALLRAGRDPATIMAMPQPLAA